MLHALFYAKSGVSMDCLISVDGGAQQDRIHGGTQSIVLQWRVSLVALCIWIMPYL